ncbi:MAG: outer membrane protein assembly factor BamA [Bacteroides sp.]
MSKILASRMSRLGIALLLLIPLWWVGVTSSLYAQESSSFSYSAPKRYIIKQIDVEGVQFLDKELLVQMTGLHVGDTIELPSNDITKAVKKLRRENLFSSVEIRVAHVEGEHASLVIELKEQPRVSDIRYEGVKSSARDELKDKLDFKNGQQATASTIDAAVRVIRKYYHEKGYRNAKVNVRQEVDTTSVNRVIVTFVVDRGKKVRVKEITFEGNHAFEDARLRKKGFKETKRILWWNPFRSAKYIEEKYREDLGQLISFYNEHGYRDARVVSDSVYPISKNEVGIKVRIEEGNQYHIRDIKWVGNTVYRSEALSEQLGMKVGDVYDQVLIEKRLQIDENSISSAYMDEGYLFFHVTPVETNITNDSVSLEMRIFEGPQATISDVIIHGNTRTSERIVRRELRTYPGDLFSRTNVIRSLRELANLGYFEPEALMQNGVRPEPNAQDGTVAMHYTVQEKQSDQFELSAGWGGGFFVATVGVRFSNFSIGRFFEKDAWRPIPSGDGQSLSIRGTTNGTQYRAFNISFTEPWLGGYKPNNFTVSFYHSVYDYSKYVWRKSDDYFKITGGSVGLGTRLKWPDDYFTLYTEFTYQNYKLRNWKQDFLFSDGTANNMSVRVAWGRNSVDQPIYPRSGSNFSLSLQLTPPYSFFNGKDYTSPKMTPQERYRWVEYHKWTARAQWYTTLVDDLVLYFNGQFGFLGFYNKKVGYSPFEGFDLGGDGLSGYNFIYGRESVGLRGYTNGSLTPYITQGVRMANVYDKFTMELRYPIVLKPQTSVYALLFADAGNSWYELNQFNPFQLHRSVGAGFRVFLPIFGMLGFDIGYGFDPVKGNADANGWQPHFVIGMPF